MPLSPAAAPAPLVADADLLPSAGADTTGGEVSVHGQRAAREVALRVVTGDAQRL